MMEIILYSNYILTLHEYKLSDQFVDGGSPDFYISKVKMG